MSKEIGFAILGAGMIAPFHAKSIRDARGGRLVAVCDAARERAERMAAEYGAQPYGDLAEMLRNPEIDVVNVVLPNHLHRDAVIACARAGKHVLTEKPPAMSLADTDAMLDACREANVKFGCTVQCRVRKTIQAARAAVRSGRFGRVLHASAYMKWFRSTEYYRSDAWRMSRKSGAGVTVQHAFHYIDLLQYLAGPVARVSARMRNIAHPEIAIEDTLVATLDYQNGAQGVVEASTALWPGLDVRLEINGLDGAAVIAGEAVGTWKFREEQPGDAAVRALGNAAQATAAGGPTDFSYADHRTVVQDMIDALRENREVVIPVASVRHTLEICLAMYQSAARGRPVELPVRDDESVWAWPTR